MAENRLKKIWGHLQPEPTAGLTNVEELPPTVPVDVLALRDLLDETHGEMRNAIRDLFEKDGTFELNAELSYHEQREQVLKWAQTIASHNFISAEDGINDPVKFVAFFESVGYFDQSTVSKLSAQYHSFGGTILNLGTEKHRELIPSVNSFETIGIFGMTELGHGSNVAGIETLATYNDSTKEFILSTPTWSAQKFWASNAAVHGNIAVIFARLIINTDEDKGIHAFLVPIRSHRDHQVLPGVTIRDMGKKAGQHGMDSGCILFDNVRIPKSNLLNKFSDINDSDDYISKLPTQRRHFAVTMNGFILGRLICVASMLSGLKVATTIGVRYAHIRKQFGPHSFGTSMVSPNNGTDENSQNSELEIITYTTHQRRLMPIIARIYAFDFFNKYLAERWAKLSSSGDEKGRSSSSIISNALTNGSLNEFHATASGFKAIVSWFAVRELQTLRECCGGQGYRPSWRIADLRDDLDMWTTAEGDNMIMMQQVVKFLLPEYEKQKNRGSFTGILAHMIKRNYKTLHGNNMNNIWLKAAFEIREAELLRELSKKMMVLKNEGVEYFDSWNQNLPLVIKIASAYVERRIFAHFYSLLADLPSHLQEPLSLLCNLDGLYRISLDMSWFVSHGVMPSESAKYIDDQLTLLCGKVAEISLPLTDAFGVPKRCLPRDINIYEKP